MRELLQGRGGRLLAALFALAFCVGLMPVRAYAAEGVYVTLGDSITAGYGLGTDEKSFPEIVSGDRGYELRNHGSSDGFTSSDLVAQLGDEAVAADVAEADVITVTVGGNDVMGALYEYLAAQTSGLMTADQIEEMLTGSGGGVSLDNPALSMVMGWLEGFPTSDEARQAIAGLSQNLAQAVASIKAANPDATIVVANQYNPYGALEGTALDAVAETFEAGVGAMNAAIETAASGAEVADVHAAFAASSESPCNAQVNGTQANLDFHPNALGHELIAQAVEGALPAAPEDPETPPAQDGPDWAAIAAEVAAAEPGSTVSVDLRGETVVPAIALEALAGRDVTVRAQVVPGIAWEISGSDVPEGSDLEDVDLGIELGTTGIPENLVGLYEGSLGSVQATLAHDGPFGFEATLVVGIDGAPAGVVANAYRYVEETGTLTFEGSATVGEDGTARLSVDHASQWLVSLDIRSHALPFPDASDGEWYSEAVRWAWLSGTMTGYADGSGLFGTSSDLTRGQAVTVLWRLAGEPEGSAELPADCDPEGFYAKAASWALGAGILTGYDSGDLGPSDKMTREQLATMLWRAAGSPEVECDLSSFSDADDVSEFADAAMRWAVSTGALRGQGDGDSLDPQGWCTRGHVATILFRLAAM